MKGLASHVVLHTYMHTHTRLRLLQLCRYETYLLTPLLHQPMFRTMTMRPFWGNHMHVHSERSRARQPEGGDPRGSLASRPLRRSDSRRRDPICPSCKVEAFIISARGREVSPSEGPTPARARARQAVGGHAHAPTHTRAVGEEV